MTEPVLSVDTLHAALGGTEVLHGVSAHVSPGETVALLGENGSGKSTLLKCVLGLLTPTAGSVHLFGASMSVRRSVPWDRVGYVPQRSGTGSGTPATVAEVVRTGLLSRRRLRAPRDARERTRHALEQVGLDSLSARPVGQLSGGQQQRVWIARALVRDPDLLVLDEPVAGVDQQSQDQFAQVLGSLHREVRSTLIVLHDLGPFAPLIDRGIILAAGSITYDGPLSTRPQAYEHTHTDHGDYEPTPTWGLE